MNKYFVINKLELISSVFTNQLSGTEEVGKPLHFARINETLFSKPSQLKLLNYIYYFYCN